MPTYQYRCTECDRDLEVVQKFSDASLTECPSCSGALRKVFNAVGVVFKGSGFYRNDSRASSGDSGESNGAGKSDSGEKSGPEKNGPDKNGSEKNGPEKNGKSDVKVEAGTSATAKGGANSTGSSDSGGSKVGAASSSTGSSSSD